ncbi:MAG: hypothetical protein LUE27_11115 [Clostridia bacterium]|nr:hypothetical protein [Clostridia bacterium]
MEVGIMRCGDKVQMDLYDFIAQYDVEESNIYVINAGKDAEGKIRYTFYFEPKYINGFYNKDDFSLTLVPEISKVLVWGKKEDGEAGYTEIEDFSFENIMESTGVAIIKVAERLYFSDRSREKKTDVFTIDSMYDFRCTIRNVPVELERIPKNEFKMIERHARGREE